ncbi:uridine kinase [Cohnella lupini]|uniref:Uridine kinase n=1 Tax=Cohnella lupini TaxID=1294267 RepID=A0A3D9IWM7_9BACL|nr:uridine kinase [Cohnella lupini]
MKKPLIISIAAVSGGGKTTVIQLLNNELANSIALFFDNYDFEGPDNLIEWAHQGGDYNEWKLSPLINDLRIILDNKDTQNDYILLDYPFAYLNKEMNEFIDLTIFIDTPLDVAMARRILRDFNYSSAEEIRLDMQSYLSGAREAYLAMLNSVKPNSDVIIDGTQGRNELVESIKQQITNHLKVTH